jgi:hypothetical protein
VPAATGLALPPPSQPPLMQQSTRAASPAQLRSSSQAARVDCAQLLDMNGARVDRGNALRSLQRANAQSVSAPTLPPARAVAPLGGNMVRLGASDKGLGGSVSVASLPPSPHADDARRHAELYLGLLQSGPPDCKGARAAAISSQPAAPCKCASIPSLSRPPRSLAHKLGLVADADRARAVTSLGAAAFERDADCVREALDSLLERAHDSRRAAAEAAAAASSSSSSEARVAPPGEQTRSGLARSQQPTAARWISGPDGYAQPAYVRLLSGRFTGGARGHGVTATTASASHTRPLTTKHIGPARRAPPAQRQPQPQPRAH